MEVHEKIAEIVALVDSARTMPMSSTAMVNKQQLLALLDEVREGLPGNLQAAEAVLGQREALLIEAQSNADRIVSNARSEHARLVADHTVTQSARIEAEEILQLAREHADTIRSDADDYVDAKLARLEVAAARIVETVRDGREQLRHPTPYEELAHHRNGRALAESAKPDNGVEPSRGEGGHGLGEDSAGLGEDSAGLGETDRSVAVGKPLHVGGRARDADPSDGWPADDDTWREVDGPDTSERPYGDDWSDGEKSYGDEKPAG